MAKLQGEEFRRFESLGSRLKDLAARWAGEGILCKENFRRYFVCMMTTRKIKGTPGSVDA